MSDQSGLITFTTRRSALGHSRAVRLHRATMARSLLLGVAALCLAASGHGAKTLLEADGILQLNGTNFDTALSAHKQLLVHFYVPLSADGRRLSEALEGAAGELDDPDVKLATVDVSKDKELAEELNATGPPYIRLYLFGDRLNFVSCPEVVQHAASIVTWLKRRAGSAADLVGNLSQLLSSEEELMVLGFFQVQSVKSSALGLLSEIALSSYVRVQELDSEYVRVFYSTAVSLPDVTFAVTRDGDVIGKYDVTHDVVLLLKQRKLIQTYKMSPRTSKEDLLTFVSVYQMDPVTEYCGKTANQILSSPVLSHALLFVNKSSADFHQVHAGFNAAAEFFRMKILFVLVDVSEPRNGRLMEYFRVGPFEAPLVRLVNLSDHVTYQLPSVAPDAESIRAFCQDYLDGGAKPKMQSEPIPEGWDQGPVKELVGSTFEKVAFNPNMTVFVLFYVPYGPECRAVFPLWEELAEAFKSRDDVAVARIDASANVIDMAMQSAYPALCLFPALYAERAVFYTGERKLKALQAFVHREMKKAAKDRLKEDDDRKKYVEAMKTEEKKARSVTKEEL